MTKPKPRNFVAAAKQSGAGKHAKKKEKRSLYDLETERKDAIHRQLHDLFYTIPPSKPEDTDENTSRD
jgi:hypothetical protein